LKILVLGGAGFIGSHLIDELLAIGHEVVVYDNLEPQVHGKIETPPSYLADNIEFFKYDIRDKSLLEKVINEVDIIYHLAAMVGVGQSMYQIKKYYDVNVNGTANLLNLLVNEEHDVKKLIVASSMSTYGEGAYNCKNCGIIYPEIRNTDQLENNNWEMICPECKSIAKSIPTNEKKPQDCTSIYALTKKEQEKMCLLIGKTYGINTTALRFFNVYGSRQALSNPYTGVCAIFSSSLLCGNPPIIYEDGGQARDFVHVKDIVQSLILSMNKDAANGEVFNVGTGKPITINQIANILSNLINPDIKPIITNQFRPGDIRHCYSDIKKIQTKLNYQPKYGFKEGMGELVEWVKKQIGNVEDKSKKAKKELIEKGLLK